MGREAKRERDTERLRLSTLFEGGVRRQKKGPDFLSVGVGFASICLCHCAFSMAYHSRINNGNDQINSSTTTFALPAGEV